ncbi:hypothetical protein EIP91_003629 [Steccherinum ochraceum]|uniref:Thioesterase domain-containing protein n=1 Tax=Steccherinum ochraceum TaxID=92696 RepID=A0A4R0RBN2_9APHY|nr:hypothetical protein EIP91_003629 [Steccherinum ochraceum]
MSSKSEAPVPSSTLSRTILSAPTNGITPELREHMFKITDGLSSIESYGNTILRNLKVTEMSLLQKEEELGKLEAKMVFETRVDDSMLNDTESMHGGCTAFLVDFCSSITLSLILAHFHRPPSQVSQTLSIVYHAPANKGVKVRIVNRTITMGKRIMSARTEVYDAEHSRLVATGVHTKMAPSDTGGGNPTRLGKL